MRHDTEPLPVDDEPTEQYVPPALDDPTEQYVPPALEVALRLLWHEHLTNARPSHRRRAARSAGR